MHSVARTALLALLTTLAIGTAVFSATVRKEHPRIFFTDDVIREVRRNIHEHQIVAEAYERLKEAAYSDAPFDRSWLSKDWAAAIALAYLLEDRDPVLLAKLKSFFEALPRSEPDSWTDGFRTQALSVAYDVAYNELSEEERAHYTKAIAQVANRIWQYYRHSDYNNHVYIEYGPLVYAALALANDGYERETAGRCMRWAEDFLKNHAVEAFAQVGGQDGGWHESRGYHAFFFSYAVHQLEAWRTATGENLFPQATGLGGDAQWMVHTDRPHDGQHVAVGDTHTNPNSPRMPDWSETFYHLPILAREYRDGIAQYWGMQALGNQPIRNWAFIIGYDPTVRPIPLEDMPTAQVFENLGWVAMRSDWTNDATFALFVCGPYYAGHQHMDQNSFVIHKQGTLAIDAGEYGAKATECHNTILIGGNQRPFGTDPVRFVTPIRPGSRCDTGHLVAYEHNDDYTYVCGDATAAYDRKKVRLFLRQLVYLRPDLFVIYDRTESVGKLPRQWMLHSLEPAELKGNEALISNWNGRLWVRMLLPEGVRSRQYQMVARRDEPGYSQKGDRKDSYIAFMPTQRAARQNFLTVLYAMGEDTPPVTSAERIDRDGRLGARVVIGDITYEATFATTGPPAGHVSIKAPDRSVEKDLATAVVR